jgi:Carboxypeptidase regulatory-like domain
MRIFQFKSAVLAMSLLVAAGMVAVSPASVAYGQSMVTGALDGTVSDASGAVVPNATVTIVNVGTSATQSVTTNGEGRYSAQSLTPGTYKISATAAGQQSTTSQINVLVGTTVAADIKITPSGDKTVIEVTSTSLPLVDTENVALATTFNEQEIQELPTPGGDVTTVAFTAPGVVVNAGGSYGNFSSDGLPGISNLFVLNGFDNQDPFLNLNNSGSSNLTLGQGELAEATVIQNAYNSQYGRAAGAIVQYTTKSGTNKFHGEVDYNWNGSALNANGWFNQETEALSGLPKTRPHAVSNEWAANAGGPIIKDKLFFFADYEGLRYVLPGSSGFITFPTTAFSDFILGNVPASALSLYTLAMNDFKKSPAYKNATPVTNGPGNNQDPNGAFGCGDMAGTAAPGGGTFGVDTPCMLVGSASANNINKEWLFTGRADWNVSNNHKIYGRYKMDRGSQPTSTSFIDPLFSAVSIQPEYEGQFNDSYVLSPNKTNVLVLAANWYSAYFGPQNLAASQAEMPVNFYYSDLGLDGSGVAASPGLPSLGVPFFLTQGRNVAQYQVEDDFSWIKGKHSLKFGGNFRRDLVSDYDQRVGVQFPYTVLLDLASFANGDPSNSPLAGFNTYNQSYTNAPTAHLALYNLGVYFQDDYQVLPKFKMTLGVRVDRTGNPLCHSACFSRYTGTFPTTGTSYLSAVNDANSNAFPKVERFNFQPRFGFNYGIGERTEIRGGAGLFSDLYPAVLLDGAVQNFPNYNTETIYAGAINTNGAGTTGAYAAAANAAVQSGYTNGQTPTDIASNLYAGGGATSVPFSPPSLNYFPGTFRIPEYLEYSLQIERQLGRSDALILTYAGNYGYNEILQNPWINAGSGLFNDGFWTGSATVGGFGANGAGAFGSKEFGVTPPDPRFGRITSYTNDAHSNYNGGMVTFKHNGHGITGEVSYTYSHSLDMISNGGSGLGFNAGSLLGQLTPNLGAGNLNYSNSDYDIRNNLVGDAVYEEPFKSSHMLLNEVLGGWVLGTKAYWRSGEPFSITNGAVFGAYPNFGSTLIAQLAPGVNVHSVTDLAPSSSHGCALGTTLCLAKSEFVDAGSQSDFGGLRRNSLYGPHYADVDMSLLKKLVQKERFTFQIGANAYNLFNKVNFAPPVGDVSSGAFGLITSAVSPPTSPYGSFQGAAVTQRLLQIHGRITF